MARTIGRLTALKINRLSQPGMHPDGGGLKPFLELHRALNGRIRAGDVRGATDKVRAILRRVTDVLPAD